MPYTQRFSPKGNDLETLNFFRDRVLSGDFEGADQQSVMAHRLYDAAIMHGSPKGGVSIRNLSVIYDAVKQGKIDLSVLDQSAQTPQGEQTYAQHEIGSSILDEWRRLQGVGQAGAGGPVRSMGNDLPRTAFPKPLETHRPVRHLESGDAVADAAGNFAYQLIDSLTLGTVGALGSVLKRIGVTDQNFWTETIGEAQEFMGMDFGEGGIKGGDTTGGKWAGAAGGLIGFLAPAAATLGTSLLVQVPTRLAAGAVRGAMVAEGLGKTAQAASMLKKAARLKKTADTMTRGGQRAAKVLSKAPATQVFKQAHRGVDALFGGKRTGKGVANVLAGVAKSESIIGFGGKKVSLEVFKKAIGQSSKTGFKEGYTIARGQSQSIMRELSKSAGSADDIAKAVINNPNVKNAANEAFKRDFRGKIFKQLNLNPAKKSHQEFADNIVNQGAKLFDDAFLKARETGLLALHEKAFAKGAKGLATGVAKLAEESANHVSGMLALGLASRTMHPFAEPDVFGIDEDDMWAASKQIGKYWLRGSGGSPFEGVMGDVIVGSMFATGGGLKLLPMFNKRQLKNPHEVMSIISGGGAGEWKTIMDQTDKQLAPIYNLLSKEIRAAEGEPTRNIFKNVARWLRRNRMDYESLAPTATNPGKPLILRNIATSFLDKVKAYGEVGGISASNIGFNQTLVNSIGTDIAAGQQVARQMNKHLANIFNHYRRTHGPALLRDISSMAGITLATSYASSPHLWREALKGNPEVHISDLVVHTLFSGMMARQPYFASGGSPYFANRGVDEPFTREVQNQLRLNRAKDALRHMGVRDSSYFMDKQTKLAELGVGPGMHPRESLTMLTDSADEYGKKRDRLLAEGDVEVAMEELNRISIVADESLKTDPDNQISEIEKKAFLELVDSHYKDYQKPGEIEEGVPQEGVLGSIIGGDGKEVPYWLIEGATAESTELNRSMMHTLVNMRKMMRAKGYIKENEPFSYQAIKRMNSRFYEQVTAKLSVIGYEVAENMINELVTGTSKELEYIKLITPDGDKPNDTNLLTVEKGYNELIKIIRDLRLAKVRVGDNENPLDTARTIQVDKEGDALIGEDIQLFGSIEKYVRQFESKAKEAFSVPEHKEGIALGTDGELLHKTVVDALVEAKIDHNRQLLLDKAILTNSEGEAFSMDKSIKPAVTEAGVGIRLGEGKDIVLKLPDPNKVDGSVIGPDGEKIEKIDAVWRLYRVLEAAGGFRIASKESDLTATQEQIDALFGEGKDFKGVRQAGEGLGRATTSGGLFGALRSIGVAIENQGFADGVKQRLLQDRSARVTPAVIEVWNSIRGAGLEVREGAQTIPALPAVSGTEREAYTIDSGGERIYSMEEAAAEYMDRGLVDALSPAQMDAFVHAVEVGVEAGQYTGTDITRLKEVDPYTTGATRIFPSSSHEQLKGLAFALDTYNADRTGEFTENLNLLSRNVHGALRSGKFTGNRRKNYRKLAMVIKRIQNDNSWAWKQALNKYMVESGTLQFDKKGKKIFKIKSDKQLVSMIKTINEYAAISNEHQARATNELARQHAQVIAEHNKKFLKNKETNVSVSDYLSLSGLEANPFEVISFTSDVKEAMESGEFGGKGVHDYMVDKTTEYINRIYGKNTMKANELIDNIKGHDPTVLYNIANQLWQQRSAPHLTPMNVAIVDKKMVFPAAFAGLGGKAQTGDFLTGSERNITRGQAVYSKMVINPSNLLAVNDLIYGKDHMGIVTVGADIVTQGGRSNFIDDPTKRDRFTDIAYSGALTAVERQLGKGNTHSGRFVFGAKYSELGGMVGLKLPENAAQRESMAASLDMVLSHYKGRDTEIQVHLKDVLFRLGRLSEMLNDQSVPLDGRNNIYDGDALKLVKERGFSHTRKALFTEFFDFMRLHQAFSADGLIETAKQYGEDSGKNPWPALHARMKLNDNHSASSFNKELLNETLLEAFKGDAVALADAGYRIGTDGKADGFYVMATDDVSVGEKYGRNKSLPNDDASPFNDSGINGTRHLLEAPGRVNGVNTNSLTGKNSPYGVSKLQFVMNGSEGRGEENLTMGTKNVVYRRVSIDNTLALNKLQAIMSRSAIKYMFGDKVLDTDFAQVEGRDDPLDIWSAVSDADNAGVRLKGKRIFIPFESLRFIHPIDSSPEQAAKSVQLANFKSNDFIEAMVKGSIDSQHADIRNLFQTMMSGYSLKDRMATRFHMLNQEGNMSQQELERMEVRGSYDYVKLGGEYAAMHHFGMGEYFLDHAKKTALDDNLFKIRTKNGSSGIYVTDDRMILTAQNVVLPHEASSRMISIDEAVIGYAFKHLNPGRVEARQRGSFGIAGKSYINQPGGVSDPAAKDKVAPDSPTDVVFFEAFRRGPDGGIAPGLEAMWHNRKWSKGVKPEYIHRDDAGNIEAPDKGAEGLHALFTSEALNEAGMARVGVEISEIWQDLMRAADPNSMVTSTANRLNKVLSEAKAAGEYDASKLPKDMDRMEIRVLSDLLGSRAMAQAGDRYSERGMKLSILEQPEFGPSKVKHGTLHNALGYLFGSYDYHKRNPNVDRGRGSQTYGVGVTSQRHPSTMMNDTLPMMSLGFHDIREGNQITMAPSDAERKMKGDVDEDHINFWYDSSIKEFTELVRNRGITGGFHEVEPRQMERQDPFMRHSDSSKDFGFRWQKGQRDSKIGIGLTSKAISVASTAIQKEIAFEWDPITGQAGGGANSIMVAPRGAMVDGKLSFGTAAENMHAGMQDRMQRITILLNEFLDAKHGAGIDPLKDGRLGIQKRVLEEFFGVYRNNGDGTYSPMDWGADPYAMDHLTHMLSPLYNVTSAGGATYENGTQRATKMYELNHKFGRYHAIFGRDPTIKTQENLSNYAQLGIRDLMPYLAKDPEKAGFDERWARGGDTLGNTMKSIKVLTPESVLKRQSLYDGMSEIINGVEGDYLKEFNESFLSIAEQDAFRAGQLLSEAVAPEQKLAAVARYSMDVTKRSNMIRSDMNRMRDHEDILAWESAKARLLLESDVKYWNKPQAVSQTKKFSPRNNYELRTMLDNWGDNVSIQQIRSILAPQDLQPGKALKRLAAALNIRQFRDDNIRKMINQNRFGARSSDELITRDLLYANVESMIKEYMADYGADGNEAVAFFDLLTPKSDGYFNKNGMDFAIYKKFPTDLYNIGIRQINGGHGGYGLSPNGMSKNWGQVVLGDIHKLMSYTRSTMDAIIDGDRMALYDIKDMIEAIESNGQQMTTAYHARDLGRWHWRQARMQQNIYLAAANRVINQGAGRDRLPKSKVVQGFSSGGHATKFLDIMDQGGMPQNERLRVLQDWNGRPATGTFQNRFIDNIGEQAMGGSWLLKMSRKPAYVEDSYYGKKIADSIRTDVTKEARAKSKGLDKSELDEGLISRKIHSREQKFYQLLINTLSVRDGEAGRLPAIGSGGKYTKASDHLRDKRFQLKEC